MYISISVLAFVTFLVFNSEAILAGGKPGTAYKESYAGWDDRSLVVDVMYGILVSANNKLQGTATDLDQLKRHGYINGTAARFYLKKGNCAVLEDIIGYTKSSAIYLSATNGNDAYWYKPGDFGKELANVTLEELEVAFVTICQF
ncbi:hypothetical protein K7432_012752 [Basidiobolus ranarum]|uniref:Uncharacterized protein n=1 Tax=Basidiobolus ranarum TaxID=34480 RepID=A0ABR2VRT5_9FUNG